MKKRSLAKPAAAALSDDDVPVDDRPRQARLEGLARGFKRAAATSGNKYELGYSEEAFDLVQPESACPREMEKDERVLQQPRDHLVGLPEG